MTEQQPKPKSKSQTYVVFRFFLFFFFATFIEMSRRFLKRKIHTASTVTECYAICVTNGRIYWIRNKN